MSQSLLFRSAVDLAQLIRTREVTSVDVVRAHLDHIARHDHKTHAIATLLADDAFAAAQQADDAVRAGSTLGPLHGVPMTIKDVYRIAGVVTTSGLPQYRRYRPATDCELVARVRRAGAILIGRSNVPFGSFDWQCRNPIFAETCNPWDLSRTPGGSSGGAAAALAAGFTPLELGSDIAGSIRHPAHCCGVLGLRTTDGLLPKHDWAAEDMPPSPWTLAVPGPMARSLDDLQLLMAVLLDAPMTKAPVKTRLKIAFSPSLGHAASNTATARHCERLANELRADGHEVVGAMPFSSPLAVDAAYRTWGIIAGYEYRRLLPRMLRAWPGRALFAWYFLDRRLGRGPLTRWFRLGLRASDDDYAVAMAERRALQTQADDFFAAHDAWISPVSPGEAFVRQPHGCDLVVDGAKVAYSAYLGNDLCPSAVLGTPALTLPIGVGDSGLPIAVQIHGARNQDVALLQLAERHLMRFIDVRIPPGFAAD